MNIKSLLLGSAAALVAVSGARAADAVVMVEPEPMEYVRVCDTYGTGFFYIPGTETCLKIGGYVRMRVQATDNAFNNDLDYGNLNSTLPAVGGTLGAPLFAAGFSDDDYNVVSRVRARLDFDAREETELGLLRSFIRVEATNRGGDAAGYTMENAFLQLGGLTAGRKDSVWAEDDGLFTDNDFSVGDFNANVLSYTFAVAGFTATISGEDDNSGDFVPDVVAKLGYEGGWGSANLYGVYDEQSTNALNAQTLFRNPITGVFATGPTVALPGYTTGAFLFDDPRFANVAGINPFTSQAFYNGDLNDDDGAFALKANVTLKDLIATGSQFKIEGSYAFDPTVYTNGGNVFGAIRGQDTILVNGQTVVVDSRTNFANGLSSEWQIGAGYQQSFNKLTARVSGFYGETFDLKFAEVNPAAPTTIREVNLGNAEYWGVGGNLEYALTSNFSVSGEVNYREIDLPTGLSDGDNTTGYVEIKRTF